MMISFVHVVNSICTSPLGCWCCMPRRSTWTIILTPNKYAHEIDSFSQSISSLWYFAEFEFVTCECSQPKWACTIQNILMYNIYSVLHFWHGRIMIWQSVASRPGKIIIFKAVYVVCLFFFSLWYVIRTSHIDRLITARWQKWLLHTAMCIHTMNASATFGSSTIAYRLCPHVTFKWWIFRHR